MLFIFSGRLRHSELRKLGVSEKAGLLAGKQRQGLAVNAPAALPVRLVGAEVNCSPCQCPFLQHPTAAAQDRILNVATKVVNRGTEIQRIARWRRKCDGPG